MVAIRGGEKLKARLDEMARNVTRPGTLRVGFLAGATYPDGTPVALIAAFNEFGTGTSPPRPFFRRMVAEKKGEWPSAIAGLLRHNDYDATLTLQQTGTVIAGQLRKSITDLTDPPLAPSTIKRKGSSKPLIETGHLLNSVDYEVV